MAKMNTRMPYMQQLYGRGKDLRECAHDNTGRCSICGAKFSPSAVVCTNGHIRQMVYRLPRAGNTLNIPMLALQCKSDGRYCSLCHCDFGDPKPVGSKCPNCKCKVGQYYDLPTLVQVSMRMVGTISDPELDLRC